MAATMMLLALLAATGGNDTESTPLDAHLQYLRHLERAEANIAAGELSAALEELDRALELDVPHTYVRMVQMNESGATAHYLAACARSLRGDVDEALAALERAAQNGFTDEALVREDPRLAATREDERFAAVAKRFRSEPTDEFSGKTVANNQFGYRLVEARKSNFPKLGERAPEIELARPGTEGTWKLSSHRGKEPVVLVFGSFT